jgi:CDP-diacylglycerol---glycerol-3-phosphate 3-phosphatidyltransferase
VAPHVLDRHGDDAIADRVRPLGLGWPNLVSVGRVALIPVLVALILVDTHAASAAAAAVFVLGAASDGLDGWLARRHRMTTATGAWLDPLSDKVFVAAPIVTLTLLGRFPAWAAVVILGREVAVSVLRWRLDVRAVSMPASRLAKWKTVSQLAAVLLYLLPLGDGADPWKLAAVVVAVALTVYSGAEYFLTSRHRVESA